MMRIITGSARGTKLYTLDGDHTRPTSERAKEAVFSMLGEAVVGARVLDLFAGSGQLGLEAISRGALNCVFGENDRAAVSVVSKNAEKTHLSDKSRVIFGDFRQVIQRCDGGLNLVFLDPPYDSGFLPVCLKTLVAAQKLASGCLVCCESRRGEAVFADGDTVGFETVKSTHYGIAEVLILRYTG